MPFDGENFQQTKPEVFSLEGLAAWLETQDPATAYRFRDVTGNCLIGRYARAMGQEWIPLHRQAMDQGWLGRVCTGVLGPETYGGALQRAREVLGIRPPRKWWQFWRAS